MKRHSCILSFIVFFLVSSGAFGDWSDFYDSLSSGSDAFLDPNTGLTAFPTLQIPMGGLYEGMGTAYTAVLQDSGFMESNPAGSSVLDYTELAVQHNNWIADANMEGVVYTIRHNDLGIGFGGKFLYVPFTGYNEWAERDGKGYYSETIGTINVSYNFFSSYSFFGLAVGANLKAAYRSVPTSIYSDDYSSQSAFTAMADFGLLTRFNLLKFYVARDKNFSLGAVVKNLGFPVDGDPLPTVTTLGFAYSPIRPVLISMDFNYPISLVPEVPAEEFNVAAGANVAVTDFFSLHGGFQYRGSNPRISIGSTVDLKEVRIVMNYTLDLTTQIQLFDRMSVSAVLKLGDEGRYSLRERVDELYVAGLESYAQGDLDNAVRYWQAAIQLNPKFQPAIDNLVLAEKAKELQKQMEKINKVE